MKTDYCIPYGHPDVFYSHIMESSFGAESNGISAFVKFNSFRYGHLIRFLGPGQISNCLDATLMDKH